MRNIKISIVSDLHLGTFGSHASEFMDYLNSINPEILILNGDIIDMWQFNKNYFPSEHFEAIQCIIDKITSGVKVYYLTGNHDDLLRKLGKIHLSNFFIQDKLTLELDGRKCWIFHGDVFDHSVHYSKWIAKLGGKAYDFLIRINRIVNLTRSHFKMPPVSFSRKIKSNVKKAVKFINDFEETAIDLAFENKFDYVICGHIHEPKIKKIQRKTREVVYLNSGDWVESLTALEYNNSEWSIYDYHHELLKSTISESSFITP